MGAETIDGVRALGFLCYPLGHAHENFNQALQIAASSLY